VKFPACLDIGISSSTPKRDHNRSITTFASAPRGSSPVLAAIALAMSDNADGFSLAHCHGKLVRKRIVL